MSGSLLDFTTNSNTVEYSGASAQNVVNQPAEATAGYYNLILSGAGTKTLSADVLKIYGNLTANSTINPAGNTLDMTGTTAQNITGSVDATLNNFTNSNTTAAVTASVNINCSGTFTNSGIELDMTSSDLGVVGTVTNSGLVKTASVSNTPLPLSKTWGGTVVYYTSSGGQTVMNGSYNILTLSNSSGTQTASGAITTTTLNNNTNVAAELNMLTYNLVATTINNSGTIRTQSLSGTPISSGLTIGGIVNYDATTGAQTVVAETSYATLIMGNTSGTQTAGGNLVATTYNSAVGGTLNMGTYTLGELTTLTHNGILRTQNTSSTPFTSGLTWGGTVVFDGASAQTLPAAASTFNNLTISNTTGVTSATNQTVNGILNLISANPDATHGSLDMLAYTLEMGLTGTTIGVGDVTGIVKRTGAFVGNEAYTFGNQHTSVTFINTGTKPAWLSCQIVLGFILPGKTGTVLRYYSFAVDGTYTDQTIARLHYLDAELNGNTEANIVFWDKDAGGHGEHGKSAINTTENWVELAGLSIGYFAPSTSHPAATLWGLSNSLLIKNTWSGATDTQWDVIANWTAGHIPLTTEDVLIPASKPNYPVLTSTSGAVAKTLEIESGASITANSYTIDISGATGAWVNNGTFTPGSGTVSLSHATLSDIVSIGGITESSYQNSWSAYANYR